MSTRQRNRKHQESLSADPTSHRAVTKSRHVVYNIKGTTTRTRWEDLDMDCLTNVFARVRMESLILKVPFVCKAWHKATLNPLCWQFLLFPDFTLNCFLSQHLGQGFRETSVSERRFGTFYDEYIKAYKIDRGRFTITSFVKLVVGLSKGSALELKTPKFCSEEALRYVSVACPRIRILSLPFKHSQIIPELIGNWKYLEELELGGSLEDIVEMVGGDLSILFEDSRVSKEFKELLALDTLVSSNLLEQILVQVDTHCKHIKGLEMRDSRFRQRQRSTIMRLLPNLKSLKLIYTSVDNESIFILPTKGMWS